MVAITQEETIICVCIKQDSINDDGGVVGEVIRNILPRHRRVGLNTKTKTLCVKKMDERRAEAKRLKKTSVTDAVRRKMIFCVLRV